MGHSRYTVRCTRCSFETVVTGDTNDVLAIVETHEEANQRHLVEFTTIV